VKERQEEIEDTLGSRVSAGLERRETLGLQPRDISRGEQTSSSSSHCDGGGITIPVLSPEEDRVMDRAMDRASPPGSSRGSDKSVRFNDQEDVLRFCSSASSASLSPPPSLIPILSPRSILKCGKGGDYSSDSGSDTGVSSLSSMQGDYELSTLV